VIFDSFFSHAGQGGRSGFTSTLTIFGSLASGSGGLGHIWALGAAGARWTWDRWRWKNEFWYWIGNPFVLSDDLSRWRGHWDRHLDDLGLGG